MHDDVTFEARLADALGRYAELAPAMDGASVARQAILAGGSARRTRWLASLRSVGSGWLGLGRPPARVAYLLIVVALALAVVVVLAAVAAFRNDVSRPLGRNGPIAFTVQGNDHGPAGVRAINADGSGDHPLAADRCPTYSTDGSVLASLSYEGSAYLVARGAEGTPLGRVLLVDAPPAAVSFALSADGARVAWFKPIPSGTTESELWVAPIDGGPGVRAVPASSVPGEFYESSLWSPDGSHIAFGGYVTDAVTGVTRRTAINVVAADGSNLRRLTARPGLLEDRMSWSPDGRFLAYVGVPDGPPVPAPSSADPLAGPPRAVFVIAADGTGDRQVTDTRSFESRPEWSPDGTVLAFETSADGEAHRLTTVHMNGPTPAGRPAPGPESPWFVWSPDGTGLLWLEITSLGSETYRSTLHSIDRDFRQPPTTVQSVDGLIICAPSWQRLDP